MPQFHYDEQVRRFLLQFARMFSNYTVEGGIDDAGNVTYVRVPIRYGDASRQAAVILQENSRNNIPCAPQMSFYIKSLEYNRDMIQNPTHVDKRYVRQREWDEGSQTYEETQGNAFNVERPMPVPHMLTLQLDIWTTNTNQKLQLYEQITTLFNPSLEIQSTDNYLDWTSLSVVERKSETWTSRSVPNGENEIDIMTFTFDIPIWISPPARVTKEGVVHQVIASIYDTNGNYVDAIDSDNILLGTRLRITPHGYQVLLIGNELRILPYTQPTDEGEIESLPDLDSEISWRAVLDEYGSVNDGITQMRLSQEGEEDIVGTVTFHPYNESVLLFTIDADTLPSNTLDPVDAVIDPLADGPDAGLPAAALGQRYLLTESTGDITDPGIAAAWYGTAELIASKDDIIEFDGTNWFVAFDASETTTKEYVTNITTNIQFKFIDGAWIRSYEGIYRGGYWDVVL